MELPCVTMSLIVRNHSYQNVFPLQIYFHANETHFHMKGFAQGLVLKQRHVTQKWRFPHFTFTQLSKVLSWFLMPLFLQFRSEVCVPKRMEEIKKAISERDFKTFAETTMKVSLYTYLPLFLQMNA